MHPLTSRSQSEHPSLSLVLPAWNECEIITTAIQEADEALRGITDTYEIIVVDDGSIDGTAELVQRVAETNPAVKLVRHSPNQGYGAALRSGFAAASMDLVGFTDADCQFDLTELDRFMLLSQRYDVVCGYRIDRKDTPLRCFYSRVYNLMVRTLLGTEVRDVDCALKVFHRDVVKDLQITGSGFLVNSELLVQAKQQGRNLVEVGVSHRPRTAGESTVSIHHIPKVLASLARYWWNQVQFPASSAPLANDKTKQHKGARLGAIASLTGGWDYTLVLQISLLILAAIFMFTNLSYPLIDRDETRYAEIPREMLATGNWVLPQLNFHTYYDKPPLLYWLCAVSFQLFGVSEFAARLVPAVAALSTMAATMWFGTRNFGKRIGLLTGVVLMLSVGFAFTSRYLLLDGVLTLFVSLSLFSAYEAIKTRQLDLRWWTLSGAFVGIAFMTKGPLAIVLWLPPVMAMAWLSESFAKPRWRHYGIVAAVASTIILPWFISVSLYDASFVKEFLITHNVRRFAGEFHPKPIWYFIPVLLIAGHPWSFLTIPYLRFLFGRRQTFRDARPPLIGFLLLWCTWLFAFFSLSSCKLPTYLLPAAPALALMFAHYLDQLLHESSESTDHWFARFWSARSATATTCLAGFGFVIFVVLTQHNVSVGTYLWAMFWTSLLMSSLLLLSDRHQAKFAWITSSVVAFLFAVMVMHHMVPSYSRSRTLFGNSSPLNEQLAVSTVPAIATLEHEFSGVPFYLNRSNISNFANAEDARFGGFVRENPNCILIVEQKVSDEKIHKALPRGSELTMIGQRGQALIYRVHAPIAAHRIAQKKKVVQ
ncbi:glycosyltransferase [Allorhodopirellula heiligendammensis]|uniref:Undecaprenyl phosphate-alpha-4-amino-4-deoxy-L-arabinose arabinosyl transferase n=1 Tax=Allorhodopirellula heiligendammensis TaxID=2714739 RepID=A0A5C6C609_9BACT|nr:glycosyltransferase [Allorhodopirellula heiligendammensis]TWU19457.1 Undecaprenyl phosphate-alpha-4-amino-4-deoxy-L-arabinose arabinosyl transferase [Allorhodopirellula heiligendammensis]